MSSHPVHLNPDGTPRIVERRFVVDEASAGMRLDLYLRRKIPRLSRARLQKIIGLDQVLRDERPLKPGSTVAAGDRIVMRGPARPEPDSPRDFGVLYRDDHLLVVDKPAGLAVHSSAKFYFNTLSRLLYDRFPDDDGIQICHRLDRETSGALVVARTRAAAAPLKRAFEDHTVRKTYLAVVYGDPPWPDEAAGGDDHVIDLPMALVPAVDDAVAVRMEVRDGGLPARTEVRVIERRGRAALVRCRPITGRQHQIRVHLAASGHAIVGDKLYAHGDEAFAAYCDEGLTDELLARFELPRQALHAARVVFPHPATGEPLGVDSPLPADLRGYLDGVSSGETAPLPPGNAAPPSPR